MTGLKCFPHKEKQAWRGLVEGDYENNKMRANR